MCYIFNSDYGDPCNISLERYLSLHFRELAIVTSCLLGLSPMPHLSNITKKAKKVEICARMHHVKS